MLKRRDALPLFLHGGEGFHHVTPSVFACEALQGPLLRSWKGDGKGPAGRVQGGYLA